VVVGVVFLSYVVGIDPIGRSLSHGARLLFVLVVLPFHAFVGIALLGTDQLLAAGWYRQVVRDWGASPLADQRTGAGILWVAGELFGVIAVIVVVRQWMRHEERVAARHDRSLAPPSPAPPSPAPPSPAPPSPAPPSPAISSTAISSAGGTHG
jgi:putative copper resistance protein D